jgi:hypothetical protein
MDGYKLGCEDIYLLFFFCFFCFFFGGISFTFNLLPA